MKKLLLAIMSIYMEKKRNLWVIPTDKPSRLADMEGLLVLGDNLKSPIGHPTMYLYQNIYITSGEKLKKRDKSLLIVDGFEPIILTHHEPVKDGYLGKKIILTTDPDLIADGIQAIDDEFLEWFVKNPSCEEVEVEKGYLGMCGFVKSSEPISKDKLHYKIIKPQEEPKQYPIGGYAPGYYGCTCVTCKTEFMGDKRAVQCEPCAIKTVDEAKQRAANYMRLKGALDTQYVDFSNPNADKISSASTASFKQERMYSEEEVKQIIDATLIEYSDFVLADIPHWFEQFKKK